MVTQHKLTHMDGLVRDCGIPNALAMEMLQSCTKPSICSMLVVNTLVCLYFVFPLQPWMCPQIKNWKGEILLFRATYHFITKKAGKINRIVANIEKQI